ncbi:MAG: DUF1178 family protein [Sphingopyxis sp.]|nr:DUF1178 family protein [Sphingopyxis sp.]
MISFDLGCSGGHVFEAWFRSSADYEDQRGRSLIACPVCGDAGVAKAVMAPNVAVKGNRKAASSLPVPLAAASTAAPAAPVMASPPDIPAPVRAMMMAVAAAQAEALPRSRWVGDRFADEARALHAEGKGDELIHGQATPEEAEALVEEGLPVLPLLVPVVPPEARN